LISTTALVTGAAPVPSIRVPPITACTCCATALVALREQSNAHRNARREPATITSAETIAIS
jgi:hypothetical protein